MPTSPVLDGRLVGHVARQDAVPEHLLGSRSPSVVVQPLLVEVVPVGAVEEEWDPADATLENANLRVGNARITGPNSRS